MNHQPTGVDCSPRNMVVPCGAPVRELSWLRNQEPGFMVDVSHIELTDNHGGCEPTYILYQWISMDISGY